MTDKEKIINLLHERLQLYRELGGLFSGGVPSTRAVDYYYAECAAIIELVKSLPEETFIDGIVTRSPDSEGCYLGSGSLLIKYDKAPLGNPKEGDRIKILKIEQQ